MTLLEEKIAALSLFPENKLYLVHKTCWEKNKDLLDFFDILTPSPVI